MQIAGFFIILMQLIAEPRYNVYFHNGNIYQVPTGVCYGENTPLQLLIWAKDMIILICWQHLSFHMPAGCRLQSWKLEDVVSRKPWWHWLLPMEQGGWAVLIEPCVPELVVSPPRWAPYRTRGVDQHGLSASDLLMAHEWGRSGWGLQDQIDAPGPGLHLPDSRQLCACVLHLTSSILQGWALHVLTFCWKGHLSQEKLGLVLLPSCGCPKEATTL